MELTEEKRNELALARNSMMSPYVAQDWEMKADFPLERRMILTKEKKFRTGWFIVGLIFYLFPGLIYLGYYVATKEQEKTLMY